MLNEFVLVACYLDEKLIIKDNNELYHGGNLLSTVVWNSSKFEDI